MFTGLVQQLGSVRSMDTTGGGAVLVIDPGAWDHRPEAGESIAVNGCCLTVAGGGEDSAASAITSTDAGDIRFDVVEQTLALTTLGTLRPGDPVNLERAVSATTLLGGHVVQGHIDGVGIVRRLVRSGSDRRVTIEPPANLLDCIVDKGSIAVDGVSLTVAALVDGSFEVALIPTTLRSTTLGGAREGAAVNLETDYLAKTVVHWLERHGR